MAIRIKTFFQVDRHIAQFSYIYLPKIVNKIEQV